MNVTALVLAAGLSKRMGAPKGMMIYNGKPLLAHIVATCLHGGINKAVVVCGQSTPAGHALTPAMATRVVGTQSNIVITQGDSGATPIDSIRCGLPHLSPEDALLLWPVDCIGVSAKQLQVLVNALTSARHTVVPTTNNKRGHPVLFGAHAWPRLQHPIADHGAHAVVREANDHLVEVPLDSPTCTLRLNTPEQAKAADVLVPPSVENPVALC